MEKLQQFLKNHPQQNNSIITKALTKNQSKETNSIIANVGFSQNQPRGKKKRR